MPADMIFTVTTQAMSMASRGQGRGVADDPVIVNLCPLPSNVKFHHLLNDCSVSLGESPSPAGNTDKMHLYFQVRKEGERAAQTTQAQH